jgi:hypothetical protein
MIHRKSNRLSISLSPKCKADLGSFIYLISTYALNQEPASHAKCAIKAFASKRRNKNIVRFATKHQLGPKSIYTLFEQSNWNLPSISVNISPAHVILALAISIAVIEIITNLPAINMKVTNQNQMKLKYQVLNNK